MVAHLTKGIVSAMVVTATLACSTGDLGSPAPQRTRARAPSEPLAAHVWSGDDAYGSGCYGRWIVDEFGLPAYAYDPDATSAAIAACASLPPVDALHQLGNGTATALAHGDGYVELFSTRTYPRFANHYAAAERNFAGGFGWVRDGGAPWSTLYPDRPAAAEYARVFGMGYAKKTVRVHDLEVDDYAFLPPGGDDVILERITLGNGSSARKTVTYVAYWDVAWWLPRPALAGYAWEWVRTSFDVGRQAVFARSTKAVGDGTTPTSSGDPEPKAGFLALLDGAVDGYDTVQSTFFGRGGRALPDRVARGSLANSVSPSGLLGNQDAAFALQTHVTLAPGERKTLTFAYGIARRGSETTLVDRVRASHVGQLEQMMAERASHVPKLSLPSDSWIARELAWDSYYLASGVSREDYFGLGVLNQGSIYKYGYGKDIALRDPLQHAMPLVYLAPEVARDSLRYVLRTMDSGGKLPYGVEGYGATTDLLWDPSDLSLWLFWALGEYVDATRDVGFLDEVQRTYGGGSASVYELAKRAWTYQVGHVGKGAHGLIRIQRADWNDLIVTDSADPTGTAADGESTMNTAIAVMAYPALAKLASSRGDAAWAGEIAGERAALFDALRRQWRGAMFNRAYVGRGAATEVGATNLFLESNAFALLSPDLLADDEASRLVARIASDNAFGTTLGLALQGPPIQPPYDDPLAAGMWYAISGAAMQGLARHAANPAARSLAWSTFEATTLARHAEVYPRTWYGIWSGPDSYYDAPSAAAAQAGTTWMPSYPVANLHAHAQALLAMVRLAGVWPSRDGYTIAPALPFTDFAWQSERVGVEYHATEVSGFVRAVAADVIAMNVALPASFGDGALAVEVGGREVSFTRAGGFVTFAMPLAADTAVGWSARVR